MKKPVLVSDFKMASLRRGLCIGGRCGIMGVWLGSSMDRAIPS